MPKIEERIKTGYSIKKILHIFKYFVEIDNTNAPPKIVRIFIKDESLATTEPAVNN